MSPGRLALVMTMVAAVGCYSPDLGDGELTCGPGNDCPTGYHCSGGRCYQGIGLLDSPPAVTVDASAPAFDAASRIDTAPPVDSPIEDPCMVLDEGAPCGWGGDACHDTSTCVGGTCTVHVKPDGAECESTSDPCKRAGTCSGGVCGGISNRPDGTQCSWPSDPCRNPATCAGGSCGGESVKPTGDIQTGGGYFDRCCDGAAVRIDSSSNCGACGIGCPSGQACYHASAWPAEMYLCKCISSASCWSGCCTNVDNICAPSTCDSPSSCIACPGNATCTEADIHYYCHY